LCFRLQEGGIDMNGTGKTLAALCVAVLLEAPAARAQPIDEAYLSGVRQWAHSLVTELERFQEDVVAELNGVKERVLYRKADAALSRAQHFHGALKAGISREHLYRDFAEMDKKVHELIDSARAVSGLPGKRLQRATARLRYADEKLHYALSKG